MFISLLLLNIILLTILFALSYSNHFAFLKGSALNPISFIALLNLFFTLDFIGLYYDPVIDLYEEPFPINIHDVIYGYIFYLLCLLLMTCGFAAGLYTSVDANKSIFRHLKAIPESYSHRVYIAVTIMCILATGVLLFSMEDLMSGDTTRQIYFTENKLLTIILSSLTPALAFYLSYKNPLSWQSILSILICSLIILATGSRGGVLMIMIVFAYALNARIIRLPLWLYFAAIPLVASLLLFVRFFFRTSSQYNSMSEFIRDEGGLFSLFFNTDEISMAEVIVTIDKWGDYVDRLPFESFFAGLMFPLPRSIFTFKPLGSGGAFTEEFSPLRWELTRSEIVTTGFGDLHLQFGYLGALIFVFILSFFWIRLVRTSIEVLGYSSIIVTPFLMWWAYLFLRSDIFNMAGDVWAFLLIAGLLVLIRYLYPTKGVNL